MALIPPPDVSGLDLSNASAVEHGDRETRAPEQPRAVAQIHAFGKQRASALDITEQFTQASLHLLPGQLVRDEGFSLFESVGALEIMDPRMDSGCVLSDEDLDPHDFDPFCLMQPMQIVAVMDQLLSHMMAWHAGYPLAQTILTSLHLHKLLAFGHVPLDQLTFPTTNTLAEDSRGTSLVADVLRPCLLAIAKCCNITIQTVMSEPYFEEEDFNTLTFNVDLLSAINPLEIDPLMKQATVVLPKLDLDPEAFHALDHRLVFYRNLLGAFSSTANGTPDSASAAWESVASLLPRLQQTHPADEMPHVLKTAFSGRVQRYLASNTPPRTMIELGWADALKQFQEMCLDNVEAYRVQALTLQPQTHALVLFAWSFSSRKPQPNTYSRSILQRLLFTNDTFMSTLTHADLIIDDLRDLVLAGHPILDQQNWQVELPTDPRHQLARKVDEFVAKAQNEYINIYRMICQNRCRVRRTMAQSLVLLDHLQALSEDLDNDINTICEDDRIALKADGPAGFYPFSAWAFFHKLRVMEWTLQLGFELDIYLVDELACMYTMFSYLTRVRSEHLVHIQTALQNRRRLFARQKVQTALVEKSLAYLGVLRAESEASTALSAALARLYSVLNESGLVHRPERNYSTPLTQHELRFKSFLAIGTPALLSASDVHDATHFASGTPIQSVLDMIGADVKVAKDRLAQCRAAEAQSGLFHGCQDVWTRNFKALTLVAIATGVAVAGLKRVCESASVDRFPVEVGLLSDRVRVEVPGPGTRHHDWWPVPRIMVL